MGFTAVLGTQLDVLFAALVFHSELVESRRADHVAGIIFLGDMVGMTRIVQSMGNIRAVRVTIMEGYRYLGALYQRKVDTVHIATVRFGESHWHALLPLCLIVLVCIKFHPI
ncbi:Uncharacterised protein [Yersinia frederiksenii]|uniref:Uncharacterized protein n=1 Tax=Yersinia frederiksenii TaxID=29484 RepID=A0AAI8ZVG8_YERFR|nr:Uncharacterised protein [Yersinia frederiksenii]